MEKGKWITDKRWRKIDEYHLSLIKKSGAYTPFISRTCPECDEWPAYIGGTQELNPATTQTRFKCANGHIFWHRKTHD